MAWLIPVVAIVVAGCSRTHYRLQADREVTQLLNEKNQPGRWGLPGFQLQYDPRSRYFDPTNPDHPPMPPDDPFSHRYMHEVDGKRGARNYHRDGDLLEIQNPRWQELIGTYAEIEPNNRIRISLDGAVQMAVIHAPDYREQVEELYLSALDVSTERFRFDAQFFGGIAPLYTHLSKNAPGAGGVSRDAVSNVTDFQVRKRFAAGGELLVGLANTIVWQFAGNDTNTNVSLLNFSFIQPLLRAGGRRFILEQLTIVERSLLANLRAFERYRQGFYTDLAIGDGGTNGPQRRGGFFGGTGLTGFSGQGSGGFGEVGNATGFGGRGNVGNNQAGAVTGGFAGGGAGTLGGYIGLLQQTQQIRNQQQNLFAQERSLPQLQMTFSAGRIDIGQVLQFEQSIETNRATLLQAINGRENSLDTFKRNQPGLPPSLQIDLDDSFIDQFQLIDAGTTKLYQRFEDFMADLAQEPKPLEQLNVPDAQLQQMLLDRFERFRREAMVNNQAIWKDVELTAARVPQRTARMSAVERDAFKTLLEQINADLRFVDRDLEELAKEVNRLQAAVGAGPETFRSLIDAAYKLRALIQEASLIQARARVERVTIEHVELEAPLALEIARANRLDWMNNRAALVDTWRLIAFNARALMSSLNLTFDGSINTQGDNPVKFRSTTSTFRAGLEFDAPFTRLLERNNYRAVLIDYQRDRRQLIQFEDSVNQTLRQTLRSLEQLEQNLEIQRRAVAIAARRVDISREELARPPGQPAAGTAQPNAGQGAGDAALGPTAALNLLTALNDLQSTQNNFMSVWLNHYAARMMLMRELGLMEIDARGVWVDRPLSEVVATAETAPAEALPPAVPQEVIDELDRQIESGEPLPTSPAPTEPEELQPPPVPAPQPPAGSARRGAQGGSQPSAAARPRSMPNPIVPPEPPMLQPPTGAMPRPDGPALSPPARGQAQTPQRSTPFGYAKGSAARKPGRGIFGREPEPQSRSAPLPDDPTERPADPSVAKELFGLPTSR